MLGITEALEDATSDHYTHLGGEGLCLLHRVSREYHGTSLISLRDLLDMRPHESPCQRIHTSCRLIKKDDRWVANHCDGDRQLPLVASREVLGKLITLFSQCELPQDLLNRLVSVIRVDSFDLGVETEVLIDREQWEDCILLRAVSDLLPSVTEFLSDIVAFNRDIASRGHHLPGQTLESCRLASSVDAQKSEALSMLDSKADLLDCKNWLGASRCVHLSEVCHSDSIKAVLV